MLFPSERIESKYRLLAQLAPEHDLALDGSFMDNLVAAIPEQAVVLDEQ